MSLISKLQPITRAFGEAFICLGLALRSSMRPGILLRSIGLCILLSAFWSWIFFTYFEPIAVGAGVVSFFVTYGALALGLLPGVSGGAGTISAMAGIGQALAMMLVVTAVLTLVVIATLYAGAIVFSIRLALRWTLMTSLRKRSLKPYPALAKRTPATSDLLNSGRYHLAPWLGISLGPVLCLLVPGLNGLLLVMLLAYLNVRFLFPAALSGLASGAEQLEAVRAQRGAIIVYGLLMLGLALIPLLNLLLPAILGSGACHLAYRGLNSATTDICPTPTVSLPTQ